jgi:DNA (cytosine-5)-methyltransferase 1
VCSLLQDADKAFWRRTQPGDKYESAAGSNRYFNHKKMYWERPSQTITTEATSKMSHPKEMRKPSWIELSLIGSYPYDYDYLGGSNKKKAYCIGMSVPPVMTAQIAAQVAEQWFGASKEEIDKPWRAE